MVAEGWILTRHEETLTAEVDGERVMFHPPRGSYFALGAVGSRVWELLESPQSISDLCDRLCREFDVDRETCRHDVDEFVNDLLGADLLEVQR